MSTQSLGCRYAKPDMAAMDVSLFSKSPGIGAQCDTARLTCGSKLAWAVKCQGRGEARQGLEKPRCGWIVSLQPCLWILALQEGPQEP